MNLRSDAFFAGGPDPSSMILYNLAHNRQADAAAALRGIAGGICAVEPVKYIRQVLSGNAFSIILNLDLDEVSHILDADIDDSLFLVQIFDRNC